MRGFTALSDRLPARAVVGLLDRYFELVTTPIAEHGGDLKGVAQPQEILTTID